MTADLARYHRQTLLRGIGARGQERLGDSTVLVMGCGALGSVAADMLARAGVGHLIVVDRDVIELTNLQRQVLFEEADVASGIPKSEAAKRRIGRINSNVRVTAIVDDIDHTNIERYAAGANAVIDGLDNIETRYLVNDLAVENRLPYVYGAAVGTTGMAFPVLPHGETPRAWDTAAKDFSTPCFRCLFEEPPPPGSAETCDTVGVLNSVIGMVANFQVAETLKILTENFDAVNRSLLTLDLWSNQFTQLNVDKAYDSGECPCCKQRRFEYLGGRGGSSAVSLCGRNAVQLRQRAASDTIDLPSLAARLRAHGPVDVNEFILQAQVVDGGARFDVTLFKDGRAIIKGTEEPSVARSVYAKYVGT